MSISDNPISRALREGGAALHALPSWLRWAIFVMSLFPGAAIWILVMLLHHRFESHSFLLGATWGAGTASSGDANAATLVASVLEFLNLEQAAMWWINALIAVVFASALLGLLVHSAWLAKPKKTAPSHEDEAAGAAN